MPTPTQPLVFFKAVLFLAGKPAGPSAMVGLRQTVTHEQTVAHLCVSHSYFDNYNGAVYKSWPVLYCLCMNYPGSMCNGVTPPPRLAGRSKSFSITVDTDGLF